MKRLLSLALLSSTLLFSACQEDTESPAVAPPQLERRGVSQDDLISLAAVVAGSQVDGTLHYLYFTESKNPGKPTSQELVDHRLTETVPMNGATIKLFNFPATSKTMYYIYAVLRVGNEISSVTELQAETI